MTTIEWVLAIIGTLIGLPVLIYLCMKMGAEGWFRGKAQAQQLDNHKLKGKDDGTTR